MGRNSQRYQSSNSNWGLWLGIGAIGGALLYNFINKQPEKKEQEMPALSEVKLSPKNIEELLGLSYEDYEYVLSNMDSRYLCTISCDVLVDPLILSCGHTFNQNSLKMYLDKDGKDCPTCRKPIDRNNITRNYSLKDIVEHEIKRILGQKNSAL